MFRPFYRLFVSAADAVATKNVEEAKNTVNGANSNETGLGLVSAEQPDDKQNTMEETEFDQFHVSFLNIYS